MSVIIGLIILIIAAVVGVAGVLTNLGDSHAIRDDFSIFGYHVTGSTGLLFLYGIIVGAVALAGLSLLLAGARGAARRERMARMELDRSRRVPYTAGGDYVVTSADQPLVSPRADVADVPHHGKRHRWGRGGTGPHPA
ncbi:hypothetical protein [Nocardia aurantia]|uniref:Uncharacterized protein n=1 Tax=Nocardia aurantia TaxID=2585199 RepID=A0A7K0DPQ3_9NOCA|nr:hypothetical protein [Nocardia aurantia]MQY27740.1 hypothetical protein [Nocardia aurantia]